MITTLPALPYNPMGFVWSTGNHSSPYSKDRVDPRTDLENLLPWDRFEADIEHAISTCMVAQKIAPGTQLDVGVMPKRKRIVKNEEMVRAEAMTQLHDLVVEVLESLGIDGQFELSSAGDNQVIGEPDFSWLQDSLHPKLVIEYKSIWSAPLQDLLGIFAKIRLNLRGLEVFERQSMEALQQLYGYMTFNDNKYGVLTNWDRAWFFQRVETAKSTGKTMRCYGPVGLDGGSQPSMLKAFVGVILLAQSEATSFHTSQTLYESPHCRHCDISNRTGRDTVGSYEPILVNGAYQVIDLGPCHCRFDRSFVRHTPQRCFTVKATLTRGTLSGDLEVFCKIVDLAQRGDSLDMLNTEVQNYATLAHLQGQVIPRVRGYFNIWGLLRFLALEDVGSSIPEAQPIDAEIRRKMRSALTRIHAEGYIHGDIERRNFCMRGAEVFLVDLEELRPGTSIEREAELARIDTL